MASLFKIGIGATLGAVYLLTPGVVFAQAAQTVDGVRGVTQLSQLNVTVPPETPKGAAPGVPGKAKLKLPAGISDNLAKQIMTLIRVALQTGNPEILQNGLFELTVNAPELAVSIAKFTTQALNEVAETPSSTTSGPSSSAASQVQSLQATKSLLKSLAVAMAVGISTAAPESFRDIIAEVEMSSPELAKIVTSKVEGGLIELFNDPEVKASDLDSLFTAAGPSLTEAPTQESASPAG